MAPIWVTRRCSPVPGRVLFARQHVGTLRWKPRSRLRRSIPSSSGIPQTRLLSSLAPFRPFCPTSWTSATLSIYWVSKSGARSVQKWPYAHKHLYCNILQYVNRRHIPANRATGWSIFQILDCEFQKQESARSVIPPAEAAGLQTGFHTARSMMRSSGGWEFV